MFMWLVGETGIRMYYAATLMIPASILVFAYPGLAVTIGALCVVTSGIESAHRLRMQ